jgi:hypothetical protein
MTMNDWENKDAIKTWLKTNRLTRVWLAEQCGVTPQCVHGWLSKSRPVPKYATEIIRRLMVEGVDQLKSSDFPSFRVAPVDVSIAVDPEIYAAFSAYAKEKGSSVKDVFYEALDFSANHFDEMMAEWRGDPNDGGGSMLS